MAARVLLIGVACTVGLIVGTAIGLQLGVREGGGDVVGVKAHPLVLPCTPTHRPATVQWIHDGVPLLTEDMDERRFVADNGSLVITKMIHKKKGESDTGVYRCRVSSHEGAILSAPYKVTVAGMSHDFLESPTNVSVVEGDIFKLTCSIESNPPANLTWLKDGKPIPQNKRYTDLGTGVLYVTNVKPEDKGRYRCQAVNNLVKKSRLSEENTVVIVRHSSVSPTSILATFLPNSPPSQIPLRLGAKGSLLCAASGLPRPNLKWIRVKSDGTNSTLQAGSSGLNIFHIDKVNAGDGGTYVCVASQVNKGKVASKVVKVDIETPPTIMESPKTQVYPPAKTVRMSCEIRGFPQPQVTWYKDGVKLHINGRIKQRAKELVLGTVVTQDTGVYQCMATSKVGAAWGAGRLVVNTSTDQPAPPSSLTCSTLSPTKVNLSWVQQPETDLNVHVHAFTVHYFPSDGGDEGKDVTNNDTFVVDKLQPYTNYTFYVRSYSGKSASEQSVRVNCKTGEAVPTGGPQVTVTLESSSCVLVTWDPPPLSQARGAITLYKVQWKKSQLNYTYFKLVAGDVNRLKLLGLTENTEYLVRVIGATSSGWPNLEDTFVPWTRVKTLSKESGIGSTSVTLISFNVSTVRLEWSYDRVDRVDEFLLVYSSNTTSRNISTLPDVFSYVISDLEPLLTYNITVIPLVNGQRGEFCTQEITPGERSSVTTSGGEVELLPAPVAFELEMIESKSVSLTWSLPDVPTSKFVTSFNVTYRIYGSNFSVNSIQTENTKVKLSDLKSDSQYEFSVTSMGENGRMSGSSVFIEFKTLPELVGTIEDVSWSPLNETSVRITWKPLTIPVSSYRIFYMTDPSAPLSLWHQETVPSNVTTVTLKSLKNNIRYVTRIRGETSTGPGPLSSVIPFSITPEALGKLSQPGVNTSKVLPSDKFIGIVVGCAISACSLILCLLSLAFRRRCMRAATGGVGGRGAQPNSLNGNGRCATLHEMQSLTQLEEKKLYRTGTNGFKLSLIGNGILSNGSARENIIRVTENPQRNTHNGVSDNNETLTTAGVGENDSLLSTTTVDDDANDTRTTLVAVSPPVATVASRLTAISKRKPLSSPSSASSSSGDDDGDDGNRNEAPPPLSSQSSKRHPLSW